MTLTAPVRVQHLRWMLLARMADDRAATLYRQGALAGSAFLGRGQEAFSAAGAMMLRDGDILAPLIRDLAARLAFGEPLIDGFRTCLGKRTGPMRGRDGNIHRGVYAGPRRQLAMVSHLGAMVAAVSGALMARRIQGRQQGPDRAVGLVSLGDGAMAAGAAHEGLNVAGVERLPLVLMLANNQLSYSTGNDRSFACARLVDRAAAYGFTGRTCDGTDADACLATMAEAIDAARSGAGPQMVVADLLRLAGHGEHDDAAYVPSELRSRFGDCLSLTERTLRATGILTDEDLARMREEARAAVQAACEAAQAEAAADPALDDWQALSTRDLREFRG
jgi:acetoin:2,6-dichlorophenolindophenol oxidoreductase subunit alpha